MNFHNIFIEVIKIDTPPKGLPYRVELDNVVSIEEIPTEMKLGLVVYKAGLKTANALEQI